MQRCANTLMLTSAWESFVEASEKFGGHVEPQAHLCVWLCCFPMVGHKDDGQRMHEMLHSRHFFICTSSCHYVKSKNWYGDCVTQHGDCMTRYGLRESNAWPWCYGNRGSAWTLQTLAQCQWVLCYYGVGIAAMTGTLPWWCLCSVCGIDITVVTRMTSVVMTTTFSQIDDFSCRDNFFSDWLSTFLSNLGKQAVTLPSG